MTVDEFLDSVPDLSDDQLAAWFAQFQSRATTPAAGDADFDHAHDELKLSVQELRGTLIKLAENRDDAQLNNAGSPWHNLWHWMRR